MKLRFVMFADTHTDHKGLIVPDGDILIFAGDMCSYGHRKEARKFIRWFEDLPHAHKIIIAGNHDCPFEEYPDFAETYIHSAIYLQDSSTTIEGIKFYGSPWQPEFMEWSFNLPRGKALKEKWDMIPNATDVLITHGPPADTLDSVRGDNIPLGCVDLKHALERVRPDLHVFGHIHSAYGIRRRWNTTYVNCSLVGDHNTIRENHPVVFDYFKT